MAKQLKINLMGDTQREQWHTVVTCLSPFITNMKGAEPILSELHRYIDFCEDTFEEIKREEEKKELETEEELAEAVEQTFKDYCVSKAAEELEKTEEELEI